MSVHRSPMRSALLLSALLSAAPAPVQAADTWSTPFGGVKRLHRKTSTQNINALVIDLCKAGISLRATAYSQKGRTASSFGALVGAHAVINGDFFSWSGYKTDGLSASGGAVWPSTADHSYVTPVAIGAGRVEIPHHSNITKHAAWMKEVVSGHPTLLDNAVHVGNPGDPLCTKRHPRTAVGISKDGKTIIWAVVDGRTSSRIGMTCAELSILLKGLGAYDAVNLDGGGSSTMWLKGIGVVNYPSDGSQRVVGNHLALYAKGSGAAAHCPCKPACNGSKIIGADCGVGDCAKFGATCVDDAKGVRCVSVFCPALGKKKVCVDKTKIGTCTDGAITTGDCAAFAAFCSTAGSAEARCISAFCVADPKQVPKAHHVCLPDGKLANCTADGGLTNAKTCPAGTKCVMANGSASCANPSAPVPDAGELVTPDVDSGAMSFDAGTVPDDHDTGVGAPLPGSDTALPPTVRQQPPTLQGGCSLSSHRGGQGLLPWLLTVALLWLSARRRRKAVVGSRGSANEKLR